ncbi:FtsW/RodA/SpoVE family cell cycle protein [Actinokineospora soli]|uniref:Probable peptidoglycan glycosyltransferase FtsW n=1 Tax=Actinokineospora soli TaxID=1048753 RepID=A0ABW2TRY5_9PSEU
MDGGSLAVLAAFSTGWDGLARVAILAALGYGLVSGARLLLGAGSCVVPAAERRATGVAYPLLGWRVVAALYGPLAGVAVGFWFGSRTPNFPWVLFVGAAAALVVHGALGWARRAALERDERAVPGPVAAAVLCGALLLEFGLLLVVRLEVATVPGGELLDAVLSWEDGLGPVIFPAVVLAAAANLGWRGTGRDAGQWLRAERRSSWWHIAAIGAVAVLFTAPFVDDPKGLTFATVATPEYGKVLYLATLAVLLSGLAFALGRGPDGVRRALRDDKRLWYAVLLFAGVALGSQLRADLGPLLVLFTVTAVALIWVIAEQAGRSIAVRGRTGVSRRAAGARTFLAASWPFFAVFGAVIVLAALVTVWQESYVRDRVEAMVEPWAYNWVAACTPAEVAVDGVPEGMRACRSTRDAIEAESRSQLARALAVIADGGLWGRGLGDTESRKLTLGSSDFVVAVVWGKLGGVVVVLLGLLLALLVCAVVRAARLSAAADERARRTVRLFAIGVAATAAVQGAYAFLATLGLVPHTGITVPFLSRGGHATTALGLALLAAVWAAYRPARPTPPGVPVPDLPPRRASACPRSRSRSRPWSPSPACSSPRSPPTVDCQSAGRTASTPRPKWTPRPARRTASHTVGPQWNSRSAATSGSTAARPRPTGRPSRATTCPRRTSPASSRSAGRRARSTTGCASSSWAAPAWPTRGCRRCPRGADWSS